MSLCLAVKRVCANCAGVFRIVRKYPSTLLWPLLVLGLVLGLGVWGVVRITKIEEASAKSRASSLALDTAIWFSQQLSVAIAPVQLMSAMVKYDPQYDAVHRLFEGLAPALLEQDPLRTIKQLEYVPNGIVADMFPVAGNNSVAEGLDLFNISDRAGALKTVQDRELTLVGPLAFFEGGHGVIVRDPIFVSGVEANETFNMTHRLNPYCGAPCAYDSANRTKFWGFAAGLISLDTLTQSNDSKLRMLEDLGYRYEVRALGATVEYDMSVVAASEQPVVQPVEAPIQLPNTQWVVRVSPAGGWRSSNFGSMVAAVVVVSVALALLLFAALVSRKRHQMLLEALLPQHVIRDLRGTDTSLLGGPRILQAETTSDLMLTLLSRLLEGHMPDLRDVVFIRQAIIRGADLYQPTDLKQHIRNANLDNDVARALMQQLGGTNATAPSVYDGSTYPYEPDYPPARASRPDSLAGSGAMGQPTQDCSTLAGALALILTPHSTGWPDTVDVPLAEPLLSDVMLLPARETEVGSVASPRLSTYSSMVRAMSLVREGPAAGSGGGGGLSSLPPAPAVAPTPGLQGGAGNGVVAVAVYKRGASMELVQEEDEQVLLRHLRLQLPLQPPQQPPQQQQQLQPVDVQRQTPGSEVRRSSLTFRDSLRLHSSCGDGSSGSEPPPAPPLFASNLAAAMVGGAGGGAGFDGDVRLTPSWVGTNQDETAPATSTISVVRRLPRRVASAISILGRPSSAQRRSSLRLATNAVPNPDAVVEGRRAIAASTAAAGQARRAPVASVADARLGGGTPSEKGVSRSGTGMELAACGSGGGSRLVLAMAGGGSSRRSQLGAPSRVVAFHRPQTGIPVPPPPPLPSPPPPLIEEVERLLAKADSWQFDTWRLRDVTNGHPLSALGFFLIHRAGLITHFNLQPAKLARLLRHIEAGYNDNPYHNATHAADVLQTLHVIIHAAQLHVHYLDPLGLLAAYFAASVHDYGHPGLTNDFLIATSDPLAVRYNDRSPLENHHAAASFALLRLPGLDLLAPLSKSERSSFRKQVIEMVLGTDMKQHFSLLSQFNTAHRLAGFVHSGETNSDPAAPGKSSPSARCPGTLRSELSEVLVDNGGGEGSEHLSPKPLDETEQLLSLQLVIKAADLGHLGEELEVHQRWLTSLEEEFFRQGDKERQLGIPISPLFDRAKQGVSKSQVGFYDFAALPLVHAVCGAFPGARPLMRCFLRNYNHWRNVSGEAPVTMPATGKAAATALPAAAAISVTTAPDTEPLESKPFGIIGR